METPSGNANVSQRSRLIHQRKEFGERLSWDWNPLPGDFHSLTLLAFQLILPQLHTIVLLKEILINLISSSLGISSGIMVCLKKFKCLLQNRDQVVLPGVLLNPGLHEDMLKMLKGAQSGEHPGVTSPSGALGDGQCLSYFWKHKNLVNFTTEMGERHSV